MENKIRELAKKLVASTIDKNYDDYNLVARAIRKLHESGWDPEGAITVLNNIVEDAYDIDWYDERINGPIVDGIKLDVDAAKAIHWLMLQKTATPLLTMKLSSWKDAYRFESYIEVSIREVVYRIKEKNAQRQLEKEKQRENEMMPKVKEAFASLGL